MTFDEERMAEGSHDAQGAAGHERTAGWRPRAQRQVTTLLVGRVHQDDGADDLCRVRNLSAGGMMLETRRPLGVGRTVRLELRNCGALEGRIVWTDGGRAGVQFLAPVNVEALLSVPLNRPARPGGPMPRAPRFDARCAAELCSGDRTHAVVLTNLSQSGARLKLPEPMTLEETLVLRIPGLAGRRATLRWLRKTEAGLGFFLPLPFQELSDWLCDAERRYSHPD
ncbi:PilZ domain-containing protein [Sphingosinithalassobacter sp. LHW66-3]|uniref:PilZ domain-containing protein n=1 Tax=Sphingosinithalassobacter sp. LHW66-3 TaxID=3424718 RepID=UPI003D6ACC2B